MSLVTLFVTSVSVSALTHVALFGYKSRKKTAPTQDEIVLALSLQTANLELTKGEYVELAGIKGCCGPFKLSGGTLPVFEYTVFEKAMMEFVRVRVEVSRPGRIEYFASIDSIKTTDSKRHGESVAVKDKYKEPFLKLSLHLYNYFPLHGKEKIYKAAAPNET